MKIIVKLTKISQGIPLNLFGINLGYRTLSGFKHAHHECLSPHRLSQPPIAWFEWIQAIILSRSIRHTETSVLFSRSQPTSPFGHPKRSTNIRTASCPPIHLRITPLVCYPLNTQLRTISSVFFLSKMICTSFRRYSRSPDLSTQHYR